MFWKERYHNVLKVNLLCNMYFESAKDHDIHEENG
jgi:hypothetical protein